MVQLIEKIIQVEFDSEEKRNQYFEKHQNDFDYAEFETIYHCGVPKYYTVIWYDLKDKKLDWHNRVNRIADLCGMNGHNSITGEKIKKPASLGTETIGGFFK